MAQVTTLTEPPSDRGVATPLKTRYGDTPETKHDLDWADLGIIDLSQFHVPGGKEHLAMKLKHAVHHTGFFYVTDFGLTEDQVNRQYAIGQELFSRPESEKLQYRAGLESGNYSGYRPLGAIETFPGMPDNVESYSVFKFLPDFKRVHPDVIERYSHEIEHFSRYVHENIVHKLLLLVAVMLELPENYFVDAHNYEVHSGCHLRYMNYRARSPEENAKFQNLYSHSHTDFGTLTLLFRQPVAALQVQTPDGQWKYVKPYPGSITVNIADTLERWTNGFLPSSVHRVVAPPPDQAHIDRLGLMYFVRPPDNLHLATVDSPVLRREGFKRDDNENDEAITAGEWLKDRVKGIWVKPVVD